MLTTLPATLTSPRAFRAWLENLPPQTRLGPNSSLFLDPFPTFLKATEGVVLLVLPDATLQWDGYGFATLDYTPLWARVLLGALDAWEGDDYTAADLLALLRDLARHTRRYHESPHESPHETPHVGDRQVGGF